VQFGQPARKYPLKARVIAWTVIVLGLALIGWMIFRTARSGLTPVTIAGVVVAAVMGWRIYRDMAHAKRR
jgi:CHASE2 domain-containing sensor protein